MADAFIVRHGGSGGVSELYNSTIETLQVADENLKAGTAVENRTVTASNDTHLDDIGICAASFMRLNDESFVMMSIRSAGTNSSLGSYVYNCELRLTVVKAKTVTGYNLPVEHGQTLVVGTFPWSPCFLRSGTAYDTVTNHCRMIRISDTRFMVLHPVCVMDQSFMMACYASVFDIDNGTITKKSEVGIDMLAQYTTYRINGFVASEDSTYVKIYVFFSKLNTIKNDIYTTVSSHPIKYEILKVAKRDGRITSGNAVEIVKTSCQYYRYTTIAQLDNENYFMCFPRSETSASMTDYMIFSIKNDTLLIKNRANFPSDPGNMYCLNVRAVDASRVCFFSKVSGKNIVAAEINSDDTITLGTWLSYVNMTGVSDLYELPDGKYCAIYSMSDGTYNTCKLFVLNISNDNIISISYSSPKGPSHVTQDIGEPAIIPPDIWWTRNMIITYTSVDNMIYCEQYFLGVTKLVKPERFYGVSLQDKKCIESCKVSVPEY